MRNKMTALALISASSVATIAHAQVSAGQGPVSSASAPVSETATPAEPDGRGGLADIVVTAQRREESLQRVPVAVTAISSEQIDQLRVTNVRNLAGIAPSLQINQQGLSSNNTIIIRGIASGASNNAVDPKVGIYIDGVYVGRTVGSIFDLADIQRVEVLRGPQGTLFGRNATSGAISLVSAAPSGEWGLRASASYGNYDAIRAKAVLDLPAFGPFSAKIAYLHDEMEGDYTNLVGGRTINLSLRDPSFGTLRYAKKLGKRNTDGAQVAIRGDFGNLIADYRFDYSDARSTGRAIQALGVIPDASGRILSPILELQPDFGGITNLSRTRIDKAVANATSEERVVTQGHSLTLTLNANDTLTVKSITAFRKFRQDPNIYDLAASGGLRFTQSQLGVVLTLPPEQVVPALRNPPLNPAIAPGPDDYFFSLLTARKTKQKQFSQELQFQVDADNFELTAGLFYFDERSPGTDILGVLEPVPNGIVTPSFFDSIFGSGTTRTLAVNNSMAGYAQATFHLSDTFDLTAGARGTIDDRELRIYEIAGGQGAELGVGRYKASYKKLTYTGIATWRPNLDSTLYAKISTGYVSGGILSGIPYEPESLTAYELGAKTQLFDNRLRVNAAAFYSDYKDLQTQNFINGRQFFDNAGKATIKGFELEVEAVPFPGLTLSANVGYSDLNYKTFILNGVEVAGYARPTYTSKWTGRAAAQYDSAEFSNGAHFQARIEGRYRSAYYLTSTPFFDLAGEEVYEDLNRRPAFWLVDGRVGVVDVPLGGSRASLSVFGQNLLDKKVASFGAPVLSLTGMFDRGRTYGVELGYAF